MAAPIIFYMDFASPYAYFAIEQIEEIGREAGRKVEWESAITAELGANGVYDQKGFARLIRAHCFGLFAVDGILGEGVSVSRYDPVAIAAIHEAYPRAQRFAKYMLYFPDAPADSAVCASVR